MFTCWSLRSSLSLLLLPFFSGLVHARAYSDSSVCLLNSPTGISIDLRMPMDFGLPSNRQPILVRGINNSDMSFAFAYYFAGYPKVCYLGIFITRIREDMEGPVVVWSANRNNPVRANATLEFTAEGDLVLTDIDGSVVWSTNTAGKSVACMSLTDTGNLVLIDENNATVWQSFDHPTDSLLLGQKLKVGQSLTPSTSALNWTEQGLLSLSLTTVGLFAQTVTNPSQVYFSFLIDFPKSSDDSNYIELAEGGFALFMNSKRNGSVLPRLDSSVRYVKFEYDGHLRSYQLFGERGVPGDLLTPYLGDCGYPTVCGEYGICNYEGHCSCPPSSEGMSYFNAADVSDHKKGCVETVPLSCEASQFHNFQEFTDIAYFSYSPYPPQFTPGLASIDKESCKEACASNCSCKAAFFRTGYGSCYLVSQVFSLAYLHGPSDSIVFIKVQNDSVPSHSKKSDTLEVVILCYSVGSLFALTILYVVMRFLVLRRHKVDEVEEGYIEQLPGLPTRFTYKDLITITQGFKKKLGEGGFGSVFEGTLIDGTKVAVKCLDGARQIKKSFLAEVETIGNIHHVNLVRLIGLCTEKHRRLLVYEYISNGSLDKWIFHKTKGSVVLDWKKRMKIIYDIAKGLSYLHEECKWKIIHMDIKPQNILLDEDFNAKVADFGLSKLLDKDQSRAMTTMRGTPGYMAPEWLSATITEKVDVYSFGVVVLEIVCGRKVTDSSQNEEDVYLDVFKRKAEEGRLLDMVDDTFEDMQLNQLHVINMMRIAAWCLQGDFLKRPSMLMVIKLLDGVVEIPDTLDYDFSHRFFMNNNANALVSVLPSVLSGPR